MPILEPVIMAECDQCGGCTDTMHMTSLAGGGWDTRNIPSQLKRWGWVVDGDKTICDECAQTSAKETNE